MCTGAGVSSPHLLHEQADSRDSLSGLLLAVGAGIAALIHGGRALRHGFFARKNSNDRSSARRARFDFNPRDGQIATSCGVVGGNAGWNGAGIHAFQGVDVGITGHEAPRLAMHLA
jgi:hypothetical protein